MDLADLHQLVEQKRRERPTGSATVARLDGGIDAIGKKVVEEAAEAWMAAKYEDRDALATELSQLLYHAVCLMVAAGLDLDAVLERV